MFSLQYIGAVVLHAKATSHNGNSQLMHEEWMETINVKVSVEIKSSTNYMYISFRKLGWIEVIVLIEVFASSTLQPAQLRRNHRKPLHANLSSLAKTLK